MNIFKLLARSTNLHKPNPASSNADGRQVPSAGKSGSLTHEKSSHDALHEVSNVPSRNKKRKRLQAEEGSTQDVPQQSNFLDTKVNIEPPQKPVILPGEKIKNGNNNADGQSASDLDIHESRRILKCNNLKVTLLDGGKNLAIRQEHRGSIAEVGRKDKYVQILPQPLTSLRHLRTKYGLSKRLCENIDLQGYREPTEVQLGSLPLLLGTDQHRGLHRHEQMGSTKRTRSDVDLITVAPTGSGKTLAFLIPTLHGLLDQRRKSRKGALEEKSREHEVQALILAPTHELIDQIVNEGRKLAPGTGIKIAAIRKGMKLHKKPNIEDLECKQNRNASLNDEKMEHQPGPWNLVKADVLVSTPLMLLHAISHPQDGKPAPIPSVRYLILDEADVLLDPLFRNQTLNVWAACKNPALTTSLWSATMGSSIEVLAQAYILDRRQKLGLYKLPESPPHHIVRVIVGLKDSAVPNISHRLVYAASEQGKLLALRQLLHSSAARDADGSPLRPPFLVFTQTIPRAVALHSELLYDISPEAGGSSRIAVLHSDLSDTARSAIMKGFKKGEIWIVITTDLLSRGVDFRGINGVVNYDIPNTGASYVHRAGRTGRQGREGGVAVTLYTKDDIPYVKNVANVIAASEGVKSKGHKTEQGKGVQQWLLDALPDVSKKTKKELKTKGVESRRTSTEGKGGRESKRMRISTKSGYDRKLENKKKGAPKDSQRRLKRYLSEGSGSESDEWTGIVD